MIRVLLACSGKSFVPWSRHPNVGRLLTPVLAACDFWHPYTCIDNFAYTHWDERRFFRMLLAAAHLAGGVKWVAVPDIVGNASGTLERFHKYSSRISRLGYPLAYVLQDGQQSHEVPWADIVAVFVGGTDQFKLGDNALALVTEAKRKSKLVHVGRVNSVTRLTRFLAVADSFDGMTFSRYPKTHLGRMLQWLSGPKARVVR